MQNFVMRRWLGALWPLHSTATAVIAVATT
jgi:hypothetical protein